MRTALLPRTPAGAEPARPLVERRRLRLLDGAETTLHVARFDRAAFAPRVAVLDPPATVRAWCERSGVADAIVGGFFLRPGGRALGDLWVDGEAVATEP